MSNRMHRQLRSISLSGLVWLVVATGLGAVTLHGLAERWSITRSNLHMRIDRLEQRVEQLEAERRLRCTSQVTMNE